MAGLEGLDAQAIGQLALLAKELSDNPKTRERFLGMTQEVVPDLSLPELELTRKMNVALAERDKKIDEMREQLQESSLRNEWKTQREEWKAQGFSNDDIKQVETLMVEGGIADKDKAAEYFRWQKQAKEASERQAQGARNPEIMGQFKDFFKNPKQTARATAYSVMQQLHSPVPAGR